MREEINKSVQLLKNGKTLLYPTDTIWGLGCDATNEEAVQRIFEIKHRPKEKSLVVLVSDDAMLERFVREVPEVAWDVIDNSQRPTTIVYPEAVGLAPSVTAADGSVAIRVANDDFCREMIRKFHRPIVSTSANISGEPPAVFFDDVSEEVKENVDYCVDWRRDDRTPSQPSVIMKIGLGGEFEFIRK